MPAYNSEKYIGEAIESILNQTFTDFELLVLNDSPDNIELENIVKEYAAKDERVKYMKNPRNLGVTESRNKLLEHAAGEYIACMDSDDISLPTRFEKEVRYMDEHPECGVLGAWFERFGNAHGVVRHPTRIKILNILADQHVGHPTVFMRKSVLDTYGFRYDNNYKWCEDFELWSRMVFVTEIHNLPVILFKYRWHGTNIGVVHGAEQYKTAQRVKHNILERLTDDVEKQQHILGCAWGQYKQGLLLPKWLGRIICLFIVRRSARHNFRDRYVKD